MDRASQEAQIISQSGDEALGNNSSIGKKRRMDVPARSQRSAPGQTPSVNSRRVSLTGFDPIESTSNSQTTSHPVTGNSPWMLETLQRTVNSETQQFTPELPVSKTPLQSILHDTHHSPQINSSATNENQIAGWESGYQPAGPENESVPRSDFSSFPMPTQSLSAPLRPGVKLPAGYTVDDMIHTYPDPTAAPSIWTPAEYAPRSNAGTEIRDVNPGDLQALSNLAVPVRSTGSRIQTAPASASTLYRRPPETGGVYPSYASGQTCLRLCRIRPTRPIPSLDT